MHREQNRYQKGKQAEQRVLRFLQNYGLKHLGNNFRTQTGEIDLILQDGSTIVFVEVRARSSSKFMNALESIDSRKVDRIIRASRQYLQYHGISEAAPCRFDVVTVTGKSRSAKIEWIRNAFEA